MKLTKTLKILLAIQLLMFGWAFQIIYFSFHDGVDSFAGLGALLPLGTFALLGVVNLVLIIIYCIQLFNKKLPLDIPVFVLAFLNILLIVFYDFIVGWAIWGLE